jgi:hypothetical protein
MLLKSDAFHSWCLKGVLISALILFSLNGTAAAGGLFGPPQSIAREGEGLHTGIGYDYRQDQYRDGGKYVFRQNQVYSELGYGTRTWDLYGRIGVSDLRILDAFRPVQPATTSSKDDFSDYGKFFGTLGGKVFHPFDSTFGIGAFLQGSYYFRDFADGVAGTQNGSGFAATLTVKNLWDVNFGVGLQARVLNEIKLYLGPYVYYSEAKISPSANIPGLPFSAGDARVHNRTPIGGFSGIDVPLAKGFHLNVEGQYSQRFSVGAAITYSY